MKHLLSSLLSLLLLLAPLTAVAEVIPVAVLSTNADGKTQTITFTMRERATATAANGEDGVYVLNKGKSYPGWNANKPFLGGSLPEGAIENTYLISSVTKAVFDEAFAQTRPVSTSYWFGGMVNLRTIEGISNLNTSEVTDMTGMFFHCEKLAGVDVSGFETAKVTSMYRMFCNCKSLKSVDVSGFNTAKVKDMSWMFGFCEQLAAVDVSNFNTSNVTAMRCMFVECKKLRSIDVSHFDTSKLKDMGSMFERCRSLTSVDVSHFNTSKVSQMKNIFSRCDALRSVDISNFDLSSLTEEQWPFTYAGNIRELTVGSNTLRSKELGPTGKTKFLLRGLGSAKQPCRLLVDKDFDWSVLGKIHAGETPADPPYYIWLEGYFRLQ